VQPFAPSGSDLGKVIGYPVVPTCEDRKYRYASSLQGSVIAGICSLDLLRLFSEPNEMPRSFESNAIMDIAGKFTL